MKLSSKKYLLILDFEANCSKDKLIYPQEIIEFPIIPFNTESGQIEEKKKFHHYCRASIPITKFCTDLTGISQSMVDEGTDFKIVLKLLQKWLLKHNFVNPITYETNFNWVTCGNWDLQTVLPNYCKYLKIKIPNNMSDYCNMKLWYKYKTGKKPRGMVDMLNALNLPLVGRYHSGIDDCYNICQIVKKLYNIC